MRTRLPVGGGGSLTPLTGFELSGESGRTPANIAIVLDESGSMSGEKIEKAKEAALLAVDLLHQIRDEILREISRYRPFYKRSISHWRDSSRPKRSCLPFCVSGSYCWCWTILSICWMGQNWC